MSSQDITLMLYPVISSREDLVSASFEHFYNFLNKNRGRKNLKSNWKNPRTELHKRGVKLNFTPSNRYDGTDLMLLF